MDIQVTVSSPDIVWRVGNFALRSQVNSNTKTNNQKVESESGENIKSIHTCVLGRFVGGILVWRVIFGYKLLRMFRV